MLTLNLKVRRQGRNKAHLPNVCGGTVASWLVRSFPGRTVRVWALTRDTVLCSWVRHFALTMPLSTQEYKWVPANCWGNLTNCGEVTYDGLASSPGEVEILLAALCYRNRDKLGQLWASLAPRLHSCPTWYLQALLSWASSSGEWATTALNELSLILFPSLNTTYLR